MAAEIHLEEAIFSLDVTLGQKQIFRIVGVDLRHPEGIAQHFNLTLETRDHQAAGCFREGPSYGGNSDAAQAAQCKHQHDGGEDRPAWDAAHRRTLMSTAVRLPADTKGSGLAAPQLRHALPVAMHPDQLTVSVETV